MNKCELLKSNRGKDILIHEGYSYHLNRRRNEKFYWRCTKKDRRRCNVTISTVYTNNSHIVTSMNIKHVHLPDPEQQIALTLKDNIKEKAYNSMDAPSQIVQRCFQNVPSTSAPYMPNKDAMRMMVHRVRNKNLPNIPKDIHEVLIPDELTKINNENFLIGHYTYNEESVIIFGTNENCRLLSLANYWLMDGTFSCCPSPFKQIYSIHAIVGAPNGTHKVLPLIYGLLSHKTVKCYEIFLEMLKSHTLNNLNIDLCPQKILTDFERAAMKAIKMVFSGSLNKLCLIHSNQSIWRHIQWPRDTLQQ